MTIQEIDIRPATANASAVAHIAIDDAEYMILGCKYYVTVIAGKYWIKSRRTLGKTFHNLADISTHYKRHGEIVEQYARQLLDLVPTPTA